MDIHSRQTKSLCKTDILTDVFRVQNSRIVEIIISESTVVLSI